MRVWILEHETHYESTTIEGVFASPVKAIARMHDLTHDRTVTRAASNWREVSKTELEAETESLIITECEVVE